MENSRVCQKNAPLPLEYPEAQFEGRNTIAERNWAINLHRCVEERVSTKINGYSQEDLNTCRKYWTQILLPHQPSPGLQPALRKAQHIQYTKIYNSDIQYTQKNIAQLTTYISYTTCTSYSYSINKYNQHMSSISDIIISPLSPIHSHTVNEMRKYNAMQWCNVM